MLDEDERDDSDTAQASYTSFPSHQSQPSSSNLIETEQRRKGEVPTKSDKDLDFPMENAEFLLQVRDNV